MRPFDAATLFGLPLVMERSEAVALVEDLRKLLERELGRSLGSTGDDIVALGPFFDPARPGSALRDALSRLAPAPKLSSQLLRRSSLIHDSAGASLVGPEGRVALDHVERAILQTPGDPVVLPISAPLEARVEAYGVYQHWAAKRLTRALELRRGTGDTMRPLTAAWLLLLLVNGSTSQESAIRKPPGAAAAPVAKAIDVVLRAFAAPLSHGSRAGAPFSFESNWIMSEASRRAFDVLGVGGPQGGDPKPHFVKRGQEEQTLDIVARDLTRRRKAPDKSVVLDAFDSFLAEYRKQLPVLASAGLAHEDRAMTRRIRVLFEDALDRYAAAS